MAVDHSVIKTILLLRELKSPVGDLGARDFSFEYLYSGAGEAHHFKLLGAGALKINLEVSA